jgi:hypothetical protein
MVYRSIVRIIIIFVVGSHNSARTGVNSARTYEQTSRDTAARLGGDDASTSTKIYVERDEEQGQRRY